MFNFRYFVITLRTRRLQWWVWKNKQIDKLLGKRRNYVVRVCSPWLFIVDGEENLRYREVVVCNKRPRWPFRRVITPGIQLVDEDAIPLMASDIHQVLKARVRIKALVTKHNARQKLKEAFNIS